MICRNSAFTVLNNMSEKLMTCFSITSINRFFNSKLWILKQHRISCVLLFWVMVPYSVLCGYQCSEGMYHLHLQGESGDRFP
jgi:hypothetical protein